MHGLYEVDADRRHSCAAGLRVVPRHVGSFAQAWQQACFMLRMPWWTLTVPASRRVDGVKTVRVDGVGLRRCSRTGLAALHDQGFDLARSSLLLELFF